MGSERHERGRLGVGFLTNNHFIGETVDYDAGRAGTIRQRSGH